MSYSEITKAVEKLKKRYDEDDPYALCRAMGIELIYGNFGTDENAIKGFFLECKRIKTITVNSDLPEIIQRLIIFHEIGHAVLHKTKAVHAFHEVALYDSNSIMEKEANLFAAEFMLNDNDVLEALNDEGAFFSAAATLNVPPELLDFKFRVLKWKGYKITEPPIESRSDFLRDLEVPYGIDND